MPDRSTSKPSGAARRSRKSLQGGAAAPLPAPPAAPPVSSDPITPEDFYRDLVWNLRNGVIAVTDGGNVAVMNHVAYRILGLEPRTTTSAGRTPPSSRISRT